MRRQPTIKQQFIKEYAKLVYGPEATSNALKGPESAKDRAVIKQLFTTIPDHDDLLSYVLWLRVNWRAVCESEKKHLGQFKEDLNHPGYYLLSIHFINLYLNHALEGRNLAS